MNSIVPAILVNKQSELEDSLTRLDGLVSSVQIDVIDGVFAPATTWPYTSGSNNNVDASFIKKHGFDVEVDLMVVSPEDTVNWLVAAGVSRVVIHASKVQDLTDVVLRVLNSFTPNDTDVSFGVAIHIDDDLSLIENVVNKTDYVQFMGISKIGKQGEKFDERVLNKINIFRKQYQNKIIQIDGGVSVSNASSLLDSGVNRLVVGSAIWKSESIGMQIKKFESIV